MAAPIQTSAKYVIIGGPREGRTFSSGAGYSGDAPGYYWTGLAIPNDVGQDGTRAVINDDTDPDFVGNASEVTGLEDADVRENAADLIEQDGGIHGEFYQSRRPFTITVQVGGNAPVATRNARIGRLQAAARALRRRGVSHREGVLIWRPEGYPEMALRFRKQAPIRSSGVMIKDVPIAGVADDPRIYGTAPRNVELIPAGTGTAGRTYNRSYDVNTPWSDSRGTVNAVNLGDGDVPVIITLTGPMTGVAVINRTTEEELSLTGTLAAGETLVLDTKRKTITLNGNVNAYDRLDLPRSRWWGLAPGTNVLELAAATYSAGAKMRVDYYDGWA